MSKNEHPSGNTERTYYYYRCEGTYEDNGSGGRRRVCSGYVFTLETRMAYCPVCGKPLGMLISKGERPEAITCAMEKCIGCENRERSAAVNDEHCLGGENYKNGRIQKVTGSQLCKGCLCAACCEEIIDDVNAVKKQGLSAVAKARERLKDFARRAARDGKMAAEIEKAYFGTIAQDPVLRGIRPETCERWATEAFQAVEKEPAKRRGGRGNA